MFKVSRAVRLSTTLALISGIALSSGAAAKFVTMAISHFSIARYSITSGQGTSATVNISPTSSVVQVVKFSSSNPAIATVPAGIPISPGGSQATVPILAGSSSGCVVITATHGTYSRTRDLIVHPAAGSNIFTLTVPDELLAYGGTFTGRVNMGLATGVAVSLTSSNPAVLTVPATSQTVRGVASFNMVTKGPGCVTISATIRSQTVRKVVQVVDIGG